MNEHRLRIRVGLFVLAGLILLAVLSLWFGGFPTFLKRHNQYTVVFREAAGVGPGTPVRRSGVHIGEVKSVTLDDDTGLVRVGILVEQRHRLRRGDQATLVRGLLGGDTSIDFVPPQAAPPEEERAPLEPGEELPGRQAPDAVSLLNQTSELVPSTQENLNEMRKSLQRFERLTPQMEEAIKEYRELARATRDTIPELRRTNDELQVTARNWGRLGERLDVLLQTNEDKLVKALDNLNDTLNRVSRVFNDENQRNLSATLHNVRVSSDNLESMTKNTDQLLRESRETVRRVNESVTHADEVLGNLRQATKPMAERSASVMKNLDESTDKLNRTLNDARDLLRAVNQGEGSLRGFINDPALYNNLNSAACSLARAMPRIEQILHDFQVFSDKIARHPESLGLGGVVSPSSGLKEAPTAVPAWQRGH
jgi:phospholipid/cholesterol/gamma-HCH transport system substrate-binding protein